MVEIIDYSNINYFVIMDWHVIHNIDYGHIFLCGGGSLWYPKAELARSCYNINCQSLKKSHLEKSHAFPVFLGEYVCLNPFFIFQKFEDDVNYWLNRNRNGHDYYGDYYQRHYDEDAAIGPRSPESFRHGASVNYDDY